eukprot:810-Heterococcus_DN1.PRE.2
MLLAAAHINALGVGTGGVRKELFQLLVAQLFDVNFGMFVRLGGNTTDSSSSGDNQNSDDGVLFFNRGCTWSPEEYQVRFATYYYRGGFIRTSTHLGIEDVGSIDPQLQRGLQQLLDYTEDDVEDVFCRTFEVEWQDLGVAHKTELKPNGASLPVTAANKDEYVALYISWLLSNSNVAIAALYYECSCANAKLTTLQHHLTLRLCHATASCTTTTLLLHYCRDSVSAQFDAFASGFHRVMGGASLRILRAEELELLVAGSQVDDFSELQSVTEYDGGYSKDHTTVQQFWEVVHAMDATSKQRLLMFATGSTRAPAGGLGKLTFKVHMFAMLAMLVYCAVSCVRLVLLLLVRTAKLRQSAIIVSVVLAMLLSLS